MLFLICGAKVLLYFVTTKHFPNILHFYRFFNHSNHPQKPVLLIILIFSEKKLAQTLDIGFLMLYLCIVRQ